MSRILVHICCAPDALYFLKRLREDFKDSHIVGFFYDPNIHPYEEYQLRLVETQRICKDLGIELYEGEYDLENWFASTKGLEKEPERGQRCSVCFDVRLERSALFAKEKGCRYFTTTLLMSPKKRFQQLVESGRKVAQKHGLEFLALDYKKGGGTQEMFKLSRENQLYMQDYCGCVYALFQQKEEDSLWDLTCFGKRAPGSREEKLFTKAVRFLAEDMGFKVQEWEFPFLGWRVLEGGVWIKGKALPSYVVPYSQSVRGRLKADVVSRKGNVLTLSKQFVKIVLLENFGDVPLREKRLTTHPTFLVPASYEEELLKNRVEIRLKTRFLEMTSEVLLIGDENTSKILGIPADVLQDGRGFTLDDVREILEEEKKNILSGKVSLCLLGAYSYGPMAKEVLAELIGREVEEVIPYPEKIHVPL